MDDFLYSSDKIVKLFFHSLLGVTVILSFRIRVVVLRPELVRLLFPCGGELVALGTEMLNALLIFKVGGLCSRLLNHLSKIVGIFKHRTRTQVIAVKRLSLMILLKQRLL